MLDEEIIGDHVVVRQNEAGKKIVLVGRGIGRQVSAGEALDMKKVQRKFMFQNDEIFAGFKRLVAEIPLEYIILSDRMIQYAKEVYAKKLSDSIYVTLTDHIYRVVSRQSYGFQMKNALRWEIRHIYKEEFLIGKKALSLLQRQCAMDLNEDEAAFIALHFVNAEMSGDIEKIVDVTKLIQEVLQMVKTHFKIDYNENSLNYSRLITHLKFLGQRIFGNKPQQGESDDEMFEMVSRRYLEVTACVKKIKDMIQKSYAYSLSKDEEFYLIIHIVKILKGE